MEPKLKEKQKKDLNKNMTRIYGITLSFLAALAITYNLLFQEFSFVYCLFYSSAFIAGRQFSKPSIQETK